MPTSSRLRAIGGAILLAVAPLGPVAAEDAAAAMTQLLESQEAVLVLLDGIEDAAGLEASRASLVAAMERAQADALALSGHAAELESSDDLEAEFAPRLQELYARRSQVEEELRARLDPATMGALDEIMLGGR